VCCVRSYEFCKTHWFCTESCERGDKFAASKFHVKCMTNFMIVMDKLHDRCVNITALLPTSVHESTRLKKPWRRKFFAEVLVKLRRSVDCQPCVKRRYLFVCAKSSRFFIDVYVFQMAPFSFRFPSRLFGEFQIPIRAICHHILFEFASRTVFGEEMLNVTVMQFLQLPY
jgi:hypothetical protein